MKIKTLLSFIIAFLALGFVACDDDMNSVGSDMQPDNDEIFVGVDTVVITAKTVSLNDSVYARTIYGLLGEYTDPLFGQIKSDYMSEFFCPDNTSFKKDFVAIDSVKFNIGFSAYNFTGDSINPMGLKICEVNKNLDKNYFTDINPADYCNMKKVLTEGAFTIVDLPQSTSSSTTYREIRLKANKSLGDRFYQEWVNSNGATFKNSDSFRKFFPGVYVTPSFGTGTLIPISYTRLNIYYKYKNGLASDGVSDSIEATTLTLPVTPEVIQMNQIKNDQTVIKKLIAPDPARAYLKSPAGVCTELTIPLKEIIEKSNGSRLNSATFRLKEFTEEEVDSKLSRPNYLLFVNKDSVANYFVDTYNNAPNFSTSFLMVRNSTYNTYQFSGGTVTSTTDNISTLINYYINRYKDEAVIPDLKYMVIPVSVDYNSSYQPTSIYNLMYPASAILRTDPANMKMGLIFTKFTDRE